MSDFASSVIKISVFNIVVWHAGLFLNFSLFLKYYDDVLQNEINYIMKQNLVTGLQQSQ